MKKLLSPLLPLCLLPLLASTAACGPRNSSTPPPAEDRSAATPAGTNAQATTAARSPAPSARKATAPAAESEATQPAPRAETRSVMSARPICYRKCQEEAERCVTRAAKHGGKGRLACNGAQRECIQSCDRMLK